MQYNHIIQTLAEKRVSGLSEDERSLIEIHVSSCAECLRAYEAAQLSESLLKARSAESIEPSPFFHTRVMAALKEKRAEAPSIFSLWQIARPIFSTMVAGVVLLLVLTFATYNSEQSSEMTQNPTIYSVDSLLLEEGEPVEEDKNYNQVLSAVFDSEDYNGEND